LLETKDQWLRVVDHAGDNFWGGKDFDNALVDWALEQLRAQAHLPDLARSNPLYARAVSRLKVACEQAKIDLSRADRATIQVSDFRAEDSSAGLEVDLSVTRADFERLVQPLIQRSLLVCRSLLDRHRLSPAAVEKVVFVGGPTLTPVVRSQVGETFSGRVAEGVDPMTVVARGAALYAATAAVDARPRRPAAPALSGLPVQIEHPNVTSDPQPFVVGRFLPPPGSKPPRRVRIERQDRDFVTADSEVSKQGSFVLQVDLAPHKQNRFRLVALDAGGAEISLSGAEFAIVHGVSIADPPLSRTVGVARSDNTVLEYFKKGTPLPARRTLVHRARAAVTAGAAQDVLNIPVVQGESQRAHRNRLIGTLRIPGTELKKNLPLGVAIEVTLHLDRSGQLKARADIPLLGQSFENVATVLVPSASPEVLAQEIAAAEARLAETRGRAFKTGNPEPLFLLEQADELLAEARAGIPLARGGDADSAQRTHRLLLELNTSLDNAEETTRWPELEAEADEDIQVHLSWVSHLGSKTEQELFDKALESANQARKNRDFAELERQLRVIRSLGNAAFAREPRAPAYNFEWYASQISEATDLRQAQALVEKGRAALAREDMQELRTINRQLRDLYPGTPEERRLSYDSGVH
jgi:molecular chaperone DnaK